MAEEIKRTGVGPDCNGTYDSNIEPGGNTDSREIIPHPYVTGTSVSKNRLFIHFDARGDGKSPCLKEVCWYSTIEPYMIKAAHEFFYKELLLETGDIRQAVLLYERNQLATFPNMTIEHLFDKGEIYRQGYKAAKRRFNTVSTEDRI